MVDRFSWTNGQLQAGESIVVNQSGVSISDGPDKIDYQKGTITLTSHRIFWQDPSINIELALSQIALCEKKDAAFASKARLLFYLSKDQTGKRPGPFTSSKYDHVEFEFRDGGCNEFYRLIQNELVKKQWLVQSMPIGSNSNFPNTRAQRTGISGIETSIQSQLNAQQQSISVAFQDLDKLMQQAKEMVNLSKMITSKIQEKRSDLTGDETVQFRSLLLSLGIENPVTKENAGSDFNVSLAKEIASILEKSMKDTNGIITLSDAFCRINRARGYELISPEDLINASGHFERLSLPVRLRVLSSGVKIFELVNRNVNEDFDKIQKLIDRFTSTSADQLANELLIPVIVARERLIDAEKVGLLCRDDSIEGLRFYLNRF